MQGVQSLEHHVEAPVRIAWARNASGVVLFDPVAPVVIQRRYPSWPECVSNIAHSRLRPTLLPSSCTEARLNPWQSVPFVGLYDRRMVQSHLSPVVAQYRSSDDVSQSRR